MKILYTRVKQPVGLGDIVSEVIHSLFGGEPCNDCQKRASKLNRWLTIVPKGAQSKREREGEE